jgi:hypothetical protein
MNPRARQRLYKLDRFTAAEQKCDMKLALLLRSVQLILILFAIKSLPSTEAGSATWNLDPTSGDSPD